MTVTELKEQIFEFGGLQVDWSDEASALAQIEADAQIIVSGFVEEGLLTTEDADALVSELMEGY
jgi:polyhydroxyalkanoate synthesis regulator phasin